MATWLTRFNKLFVLWILLCSGLAVLVPTAFTWFRPYIEPGLGVIMLGMGMTLVPRDFAHVFAQRRAVALGVIAQYGAMPLGGFLTAKLLGLPQALLLGVVLVTACPGGTASNVIAYLAGADVALSVSMTTVSTLLSPICTPLLLRFYAGEIISVSFATQAVKIAKIIVVPVLVGLVLRFLLDRSERRRLVAGLLQGFPAVSVVFIVLIVACIVALNRGRLGEFGPPVIAAVALTNAFGLLAGYGLGRVAGMDRRTSRTLAIEVGMQNSGLGVTLANAFFTPAAALPCAFFSLWHNITGPGLASYWSGRPVGEAPREAGRST